MDVLCNESENESMVFSNVMDEAENKDNPNMELPLSGPTVSNFSSTW